jgi:hypothetical protein
MTSPGGRQSAPGAGAGDRRLARALSRRHIPDQPRGKDADFDVGALRRSAKQIECLVGATPALCHQDALGLLDDRHRLELGLQPGERGFAQPLMLGPGAVHPLECQLKLCPDRFEPLDLRLELQPQLG